MNFKIKLALFVSGSLVFFGETSHSEAKVEPGIYTVRNELPRVKVIDGIAKIRKKCPYQTGESYCVKVLVEQSWIESCLSGTGDAVTFDIKLLSKSGKTIGIYSSWRHGDSDKQLFKGKRLLFTYPKVPRGAERVFRAKVVQAVCVIY